MTLEQAIAEETRRYVAACERAAKWRRLADAARLSGRLLAAQAREGQELHARRAAHRHLMTLRRLRGNGYQIFSHEADTWAPQGVSDTPGIDAKV